jgi:hypothetical protein
MSDQNIADLVDCLRHRPVATTAAQMRQAAILLERMRTILHQCAWMALDAEDPVSRQKQDNARELLREIEPSASRGAGHGE